MAKVKHETRKHALLSASGASRWLSCTPSARLEEKFDASKTSVYAEEGTLAHEFGDLNLRLFNNEITDKIFKAEVKKLKTHNLYSTEMDTEVDKYVTAVIEAFNIAKAKTPDAKLLIEERVDFSHLVEKGFGTGDACIIADGVLEIIDLKYGKGIKVDADENPQLMLYGSGALRGSELLYDIHTVRMTIVQPRLDHISNWEISADDLRAWGEDTVKPKAVEAYKGAGEQVAGEHCKFCKVKPMCKALAAKNMDLAKHDFADPQMLTEEEIIGIFKQQPMLIDWVSSVSEYILDEALKGKKWDGYKLVEGRSNRKYTDEDKIIETLKKKKFKVKDFMVSKLATITALEKIIGKADFQDLISGYVVKPPGKPTLVPTSDKRPAMGIEQAMEDFKD